MPLLITKASETEHRLTMADELFFLASLSLNTSDEILGRHKIRTENKGILEKLDFSYESVHNTHKCQREPE
jgi:hypothetical protein